MELIQIGKSKINGSQISTVDARELHAFLESRQDFSTWIKGRIAQYDFAENQDFITLHKKVERQILIEYFLTGKGQMYFGSKLREAFAQEVSA